MGTEAFQSVEMEPFGSMPHGSGTLPGLGDFGMASVVHSESWLKSNLHPSAQEFLVWASVHLHACADPFLRWAFLLGPARSPAHNQSLVSLATATEARA
jgi:hypothetical protein